MKILVIGAGYVGLVSATCFAEMGYHVICLDIDSKKIQLLNQGYVPIYEPGLAEMLQRNLKAKRLSFSTNYDQSVPLADICFIAVDTPITSEGHIDITQVENVARTLGNYLKNGCLVVTKSTVPVGTTKRIQEIIRETSDKRGIEFDVVSNPEFLKEGNAIQDFMKPDRILIGANHEQSISIMKELYSPFMVNSDRLLVMDIHSAELSKYTANAMLAVRISFMNEIACLCEKLGADVNQVRRAIGSDERIGNKFLYSGVGFGGSCLPKDVQGLISQGEKCDIELSILKAVQAVNYHQKQLMGLKLKSYFKNKGGLKGKIIGILGLSFKPDTDDMREASSLVLIRELLDLGATVRLFDPIAMPKAQALLKDQENIIWCQDELDTATGAHAVVLMTEWKQFRLLDFEDMKKNMAGHAFFDGRNQYHAHEIAAKGFDYFGIGQLPAYATRT